LIRIELDGEHRIVAAVTEWKLGIDAEGKSLESIASPLSSQN
jgi:hypothetical protein